jgi:hypothetical protein
LSSDSQSAWAHRANATVLEVAGLLRWNTEAQQCALALHATTIELHAGCLALADTGRAAGVPIVLRSLYEAVVDLENLLIDAQFLKNMEAVNITQVQKLLIQGRVNPLFRGLDQGSDIKTNLRDFGNRLAALKKQGRGLLSIEDRCAAVNRSDEYRTIYALLTLDVHNNLAALGDRHFVNQGEKGTITIFGYDPLRSVPLQLALATGFLMQSADIVHQASRTNVTVVRQFLEDFDRAHKASGQPAIG